MTEAVQVIETSIEKEIKSELDKVAVVVSSGTFDKDSYIDIEINPVNEEIITANGRIMAVKNILNTTTELKAYTLYGEELGQSDFKKEVEIKIHYDETAVEIAGVDENTLKIYVLEEEYGHWKKVEGGQTVDAVGNYVSTKIGHFSIYCLMGVGGDLDILNFVNYPNPFSVGTVFTFELTKNADVKINIYTSSGRLVKRFEEKNMAAGYCEIPISGTWDGSDGSNPPQQLANGVYFYKITATPTEGKSVQKTGKLIILR